MIRSADRSVSHTTVKTVVDAPERLGREFDTWDVDDSLARISR